MHPLARREGLINHGYDEQLVVYDRTNDSVHRLSESCAIVWELADGDTSVDEMAAGIADRTELPADVEMVWLAVEQLDRAGLMQACGDAPGESISRRQLAKRLGLTASALIAIPAIVTTMAPSVAAAGSGPQPPSSTEAPESTQGPT